LTVHPDFWDRKVGGRLMEPAMAAFADWDVSFAGLFTFAHSAKHHSLYQKFGFWPRFLTAIVSQARGRPRHRARRHALFGIADLRANTAGSRAHPDGQVHEGLDLTREIEAIHRNKLGETLLLRGNTQLEGLAMCHCGPGSEAARMSVT
jgi:hypothetical protein